MDPFGTTVLTQLAGGIATGIARSTGRWARETLGTPEREKALERCGVAGLEALVREGVAGDAEHPDHVRGVLKEFFDNPITQRKLLERLRGKPVEARDLAELFAEECDPETIPELDPERGFEAFLEAFEGQAIEEESLQEVLKTGHAVAQTRFGRKSVAASWETVRALRELPALAERARREGEARDHADAAAGAERAYLLKMRREWQLLPLVVLGGERGPTDEVTLDDVYVELDTTHRVSRDGEEAEAAPSGEMPGRERDSRPLTAREAAVAHERLVLLGDPGSGKSTFVQELLARSAAARLGEGRAPEGLGEVPLPVLIVLRSLSSRLARLELPASPERERRRRLAGAVRAEALAILGRFELAGFEEGLAEAWEEGRCLVALDGLDEVPPARRALVREAVDAAAREDGGPGRMIVTCRVRSYGGEAELTGFAAYTLAPFDEEKVWQFCRGWYRAQSAGRAAESKGGELARAAVAQELRELAANPMLLTTMALVHQRNVGLPRERVRLYDEAVKVLLVRWQKEKRGDGEQAAEGQDASRGKADRGDDAALAELLADERRLRRALERLAYEAQRVGGTEGEEAAGLSRGHVLTILECPEYLDSPELAGRFLDYVDQRAGLLVGHGGGEGPPASYSFPHRTFQEYLAGCHLVGQRGRVREVFSRAGEGDLWSVATELGAEALYLVRDNLHGLLDLAYGLCGAEAPATEQERRVLLWSGRAAAVAGREEIERDTDSRSGGAAYLERLVPRLADLLGEGLPPLERIEAGRALARLGDPRKGVTSISGMELCRVPAGELWWVGGEDFLGAEKTPWERRRVERGYWISRFLVTVGQYGEFVAAGGYREGRYWKEAQEAGVWQAGTVTDDWGEVSVDGPREIGERFSLTNHPVVGVTWYEAVAFTRWLTGRLQKKGLPEGWEVALPSEVEWEMAARGALELPAEGPRIEPLESVLATGVAADGDPADTLPNPFPCRRYPWGDDEASPEHASYRATDIGATSAVGCFPRGVSPYGCEELAGSVDEWCRDVRGSESTYREAVAPLWGGSWVHPARDLAAAFRFWYSPAGRDPGIGFRVVLSSESEHA